MFALLSAFTSIVGFLYKHRGAVESPAVEWRRPVCSSLALFRSRWYTLGIVVATASWGFHVAALALAPISLVQSVIAGGLVLLTVVADRLFGFAVTRREWIGVALTAAGLAFLAATLGDTADEAHSDYAAATLVVLRRWRRGAGLRRGGGRPRHGPRRHAAGGVGRAHVGRVRRVDQGAQRAGRRGLRAVLIHPLALVILALSLIGLGVSARSLQVGEGRAGDRRHERRRERVHDRRRARSCSASRCPTTRSGWSCGCWPSRW